MSLLSLKYVEVLRNRRVFIDPFFLIRVTSLNKARYTYYYGSEYYRFLASFISTISFLIIILIFEIFSTLSFPSLTTLIGSFVFGVGIPLVIIGLFIQNTKKDLKLALLFALGTSFIAIAIFILIYNPNTIIQLTGSILTGVLIVVLRKLYKSVLIVKIFPNRLLIDSREIPYASMKLVKFGIGTVEENITPRMTPKSLKILSPIIQESKGRDITIFHYHILIELDTEVLACQSITHRNQFAQNIRNAWIETWRWDGTDIAPDGWKRPEKIPES